MGLDRFGVRFAFPRMPPPLAMRLPDMGHPAFCVAGTKKPQGEPRGFLVVVSVGLELDTRVKLRGTATIGLSTGDLAKARGGWAPYCAGHRELGVVRDVVEIGLEVQPGRFTEVKAEAATKAEIEVVVARTVDVVRSGTWIVAEGVSRRIDERV